MAGNSKTNESEPLWYAFVTRPRHEKKAQMSLEGAGIENFLPLKKSLHQWKDRRRWVEEPLFSCYIFARIAYNRRWDVLTSPSVARIVSFLDTPAPVRDQEIETIRRILTTEVDVEVQPGLLPGTQVRIGSGPLAGLEGKLTGQRGQKWFVVQIPAIGKSVLVSMGENIVEAIWPAGADAGKQRRLRIGHKRGFDDALSGELFPKINCIFSRYHLDDISIFIKLLDSVCH